MSLPRLIVLTAACALLLAPLAQAEAPTPGELAACKQKAIDYLKTSQADDGTWTSPKTIGISALATYSMLNAGVPEDDPAVRKGLDLIAALSQPDGSLVVAGSRIPAYETSVAMLALQAGNKSGRYDEALKNAQQYLRGAQITEEDSVDSTDLSYGGVGYSAQGGRPDLSNTAFFLEALQSAGVSSDDPAVQKAMTFVSRCQNLESSYNTSPEAAKINDGGFFYTVSAGGVSPAGQGPDGGLRSYGSMTYAGFKSMLYAGLEEDDPRVKAAVKWIGQNFTVKSNPGMGANGLYYYYYLFSKALGASGVTQLEDENGVQHDWRGELASQLIATQKPNGSWVNADSNRWMEGDPNLVTAYVLVALQSCDPAAKAE
ncbi:MAG: prenyltransferase/squalene oxidase repeat-containing protein [Planctomycetaceae bacterium]